MRIPDNFLLLGCDFRIVRQSCVFRCISEHQVSIDNVIVMFELVRVVHRDNFFTIVQTSAFLTLLRRGIIEETVHNARLFLAAKLLLLIEIIVIHASGEIYR